MVSLRASLAALGALKGTKDGTQSAPAALSTVRRNAPVDAEWAPWPWANATSEQRVKLVRQPVLGMIGEIEPDKLDDSAIKYNYD